MILRDSDRFWTSLDAQSLRLFKVNQRVLVVLGFVFTQAQQCPRSAELRLEINHSLEWFNRVLVSSGAEIDQTEIHPAFLPCGTQLQRSLIVADCLLDIPRVPGRDGLLGKFVKAGNAAARCACSTCGLRRSGSRLCRRRTSFVEMRNPL